MQDIILDQNCPPDLSDSSDSSDSNDSNDSNDSSDSSDDVDAPKQVKTNQQWANEEVNDFKLFKKTKHIILVVIIIMKQSKCSKGTALLLGHSLFGPIAGIEKAGEKNPSKNNLIIIRYIDDLWSMNLVSFPITTRKGFQNWVEREYKRGYKL